MPVLCYYLSGTEYASEPETVTELEVTNEEEPTITVDATTVDATTDAVGTDEALSQEVPAMVDQTVTDTEQIQ
jgi:hypothetical protein